MDREELLASARKMKPSDLLEKVLHGTYTPGIDDAVLIERIKEMQGELLMANIALLRL